MVDDFGARCRAIVEPLFGHTLTPADGLRVPEGLVVPDVLREFYRTVGGFPPVMTAHNRFYAPTGLDRVADKVVFCEENQVVVRWGFDHALRSAADPPVYQRADGRPWHMEADRCSDFLAGMIYRQALNGGLPLVEFEYGVGEEVRRAAEGWPLVWYDADSRVFSRGPAVFSLTRTSRGTEVQAAGPSETVLDEVWSSLGLTTG
jgi:hypothetical protein